MTKIALAVLMAGPAIPAWRADAKCIPLYQVDSTEVKSDRLVLFHMRDGVTYANDLPDNCPGLAMAPYGFTYSPNDPGSDILCDNLGIFTVNEQIGIPGPVCSWGKFRMLPKKR